VASGQQKAFLQGHTSAVTSVAFSPDGKTLASASGWGDGTTPELLLWDVATGQQRSLKGHTSAVRSVAFSPDGKTLASADGGGVRVWEVATGQHRATLKEQTTYAVAFSPDGKTLVCAGDVDRAVKLWDVATREQKATLKGHTEAVRSVAFSPDGN